MAPIVIDSIFAEMMNSNGAVPLQLHDFPGQKTVRDLKKAISLKLGKTDHVSDIEAAFGAHALADSKFKYCCTNEVSNSGQWTELLHPITSSRYSNLFPHYVFEKSHTFRATLSTLFVTLSTLRRRMRPQHLTQSIQ